jgi:hypothetical protein
MDERYAPQPVASWFKYAAIGAILFMAIGCAGYLMDVTTDPASLAVDQRALFAARPLWMTAAYAIAVWVGLLGAILLLMRKRLAEILLLVSLIAAVVTFAPYAVIPRVSELVTTNDIAAAVIVLLITAAIYSFARHSRQRGWLR